ncbi:MAG: hypothetical protein ACXW1Z_19065 [Methylobacter sp.]
MSGLFSSIDAMLGRKPQQVDGLFMSMNNEPPAPAQPSWWDSILGMPQAYDGTGGSGLQGLGMGENSAKAARMAGLLGLAMGGVSATMGEGFLSGAGMGLLGGGFGSFLQNRDHNSEMASATGNSTGSDKSKLSTNQKLLFSGADMLSKDPQADQEAHIMEMLGTLPKAKKPQWTGSALPTNQAVGRI